MHTCGECTVNRSSIHHNISQKIPVTHHTMDETLTNAKHFEPAHNACKYKYTNTYKTNTHMQLPGKHRNTIRAQDVSPKICKIKQ